MNLCGIYDDEKLEVLNMNLNLAKVTINPINILTIRSFTKSSQGK